MHHIIISNIIVANDTSRITSRFFFPCPRCLQSFFFSRRKSFSQAFILLAFELNSCLLSNASIPVSPFLLTHWPFNSQCWLFFPYFSCFPPIRTNFYLIFTFTKNFCQTFFGFADLFCYLSGFYLFSLHNIQDDILKMYLLVFRSLFLFLSILFVAILLILSLLISSWLAKQTACFFALFSFAHLHVYCNRCTKRLAKNWFY